MRKHLQVALACVLLTTTMQAQRHGRPDAVQNYLNRHKPPNPIFSVRLEETKKWLHIYKSEMSGLKVSSISVIDPATGITHTYTGVLLHDLFPDQAGLDHLAVFRSTHWTDKHVLTSDGRNINEGVLLAYARDGKVRQFYSFVMFPKNANPILVNEVASIKLGLSKR